MDIDDIKALSFDTGGTVLDWHSGFRAALADAGSRRGVDRDWTAIANELRVRSLQRTLYLGEHEPPAYNLDEAHRVTLDEICAERGLDAFTDQDRHDIAWTAFHELDAWPDFPAVVPRLQSRFIVGTHTILSFRAIIDTARRNGFRWDVVFSCEGIGKYKNLPASYRAVTAWLALAPSEIMMVACHRSDLDGARSVGLRTAFVGRPDEWGAAEAPDPADCEPGTECDIVVETFGELADALGA